MVVSTLYVLWKKLMIFFEITLFIKHLISEFSKNKATTVY